MIKTRVTSQWKEALDLVEQGKGVWGEHPQIGEVVLRPDPNDEGYFGIVYPGRQGFINGTLSVEIYFIEAKRTARMDFTIIRAFDDPDEAVQAIQAVTDWNCQPVTMGKQSGYRYTRQAIPAVPANAEPNVRLYWDKELQMQRRMTTHDALSVVRSKAGARR